MGRKSRRTFTEQKGGGRAAPIVASSSSGAEHVRIWLNKLMQSNGRKGYLQLCPGTRIAGLLRAAIYREFPYMRARQATPEILAKLRRPRAHQSFHLRIRGFTASETVSPTPADVQYLYFQLFPRLFGSSSGINRKFISKLFLSFKGRRLRRRSGA